MVLLKYIRLTHIPNVFLSGSESLFQTLKQIIILLICWTLFVHVWLKKETIMRTLIATHYTQKVCILYLFLTFITRIHPIDSCYGHFYGHNCLWPFMVILSFIFPKPEKKTIINQFNEDCKEGFTSSSISLYQGRIFKV